MMKGNIALYAYGNGCFAFLFGFKEYIHIICRNGLYFCGAIGMYLNS